MTAKRSRPVIGVTGPDEGGEAAWWFTRVAVFLAGGRAVHITPQEPHSIEGLDGLIVGGGADVDPRLYGYEAEQVVPKHKPDDEPVLLFLLELLLLPLTFVARKLSGVAARHCGGDEGRDALEMRLIDAAVKRGLPVLGICRGEQLLNVYFGGTLHRELTGFYVEDPEVRSILPSKRIEVTEGSHLASALKGRSVRVNALHRQAVDRIGAGMRVAARDRNGIVQAIEHEELPFCVGVQWHPEYLQQLAEQRGIFRRLVEAAGEAGEGIENTR